MGIELTPCERHNLLYFGECPDCIADRKSAVEVRAFAKAILHGDEKHRAWLLRAAEQFINHEPIEESK